MINELEAYSNLSKFIGEKPYIALCREYEKSYAFFLSPGPSNGKKQFVGGMIVVDRENGDVLDMYDPKCETIAMGRWKPIPPNRFNKYSKS